MLGLMPAQARKAMPSSMAEDATGVALGGEAAIPAPTPGHPLLAGPLDMIIKDAAEGGPGSAERCAVAEAAQLRLRDALGDARQRLHGNDAALLAMMRLPLGEASFKLGSFLARRSLDASAGSTSREPCAVAATASHVAALRCSSSAWMTLLLFQKLLAGALRGSLWRLATQSYAKKIGAAKSASGQGDHPRPPCIPATCDRAAGRDEGARPLEHRLCWWLGCS